MTSKGGSGGGSSAQFSMPPYYTKKAGRAQAAASIPVLQEYAAQLLELLRTGGITKQVPIMQRTTEAAAKSASDTTRSAETAVARSGAGEYGRNFVEGTKAQGGFNVSQAALSVIKAMLGETQNFALLRGSPVMGGQVSIGSSSGGGGGGGGLDLGGLAQLFNVGKNIFGGTPVPPVVP